MVKWKRAMAILVVVFSSINIYLYWGTPAVFGWVVAIAGWIDHCFKEV